jgi:transcriptional regulator with GAF, ATPase, and Fis domain
MLDRVAWFHLFGTDRPSREFHPLSSLAAAGLSLRPLERGEPEGAGLVFFDEVSDPLCAFVRDVSHAGRRRVLAVATTPGALGAGDPWRLLRQGTCDVLSWDRSPDPAREVLSRLERWAAVDRLVESPLVRNHLVGESPAWTSLLRQVVEVAAFSDAAVLLLGESGTGKELVARLIHSLDPRPRRKDLVVLDCTTVVPELAGSEFFGHERGAYTGAQGPRDGAFSLADGGTLFLDEVGELPLALQAQLLRVVQEKTYKRVGGNSWSRAAFRLVCATNRVLQDEVARREFRADLYYRIAAVTCRVPPLRDRPEDVLPLFRHFWQQLRPGAEPPELDDCVREHLLRRPYPGNVRDLRQLVARIACRHVGPGPVTPGDLPEDERPTADGPEDWCDGDFEAAIRRALAQGVTLKEIGRLASEAAIRMALGEAEGNLQRAARRLGVTDRALQMRRAAERRGPGELAEPRG